MLRPLRVITPPGPSLPVIPGASERVLRRSARPLVLLSLLFSWSCGATPPTAPSPTISAVRVLRSAATEVTDQGGRFAAYVVDSDGGYREVTIEAQFSLSAPGSVSAPFVGGRIVSVNPTTAPVVLRATYSGVVGEVTLPPAIPGPPPNAVPRLELRDLVTPVGIGASVRHRVEYLAPGPVVNVTSLAEWRSENPAVATVEQGEVRAVSIGSTRIFVTYQGLTKGYALSVLPGFQRP